MSDTPGLGQTASQLMQDMKVANEAAVRQHDATQNAGATFQQQLDANRRAEFQRQAEAVKRIDVLRRAQNQVLNGTHVGGNRRTQRSKLVKTINHLIKGQDEMGKIVEQALSGVMHSGPQVLTMQAQVFRYTQELEYSTKLLDKADKGTKQVLNTTMG